MDWLKNLSRRQQLIITLTIVIFGVRYGVLHFLGTNANFFTLALAVLLFPETYLVGMALEERGWSETSSAFWMHMAILFTSYLCALLILFINSRCPARFTDKGDQDTRT
jgi:hypothetical protein